MFPEGKVIVELLDTFEVEAADLNSDDDGDIGDQNDEGEKEKKEFEEKLIENDLEPDAQQMKGNKVHLAMNEIGPEIGKRIEELFVEFLESVDDEVDFEMEGDDAQNYKTIIAQIMQDKNLKLK
jgi:hypothetical protein